MIDEDPALVSRLKRPLSVPQVSGMMIWYFDSIYRTLPEEYISLKVMAVESTELQTRDVDDLKAVSSIFLASARAVDGLSSGKVI